MNKKTNKQNRERFTFTLPPTLIEDGKKVVNSKPELSSLSHLVEMGIIKIIKEVKENE